MIARGSMPPKGFPQPEAAAVRAVIDWIDTAAAEAARNVKAEPGRVTARRLNRTEYNNTIRDLFGVDLRPADDFPVDDSGYGFDNIADVLTVSPTLMEKYLTAAGKVARAVVVTDRTPPQPAVLRFSAPRGEGEIKTIGGVGEIPYSPAGRLSVTYRFPATGDYEIDLSYVDRRRVPVDAGPARGHLGFGRYQPHAAARFPGGGVLRRPAELRVIRDDRASGCRNACLDAADQRRHPAHAVVHRGPDGPDAEDRAGQRAGDGRRTVRGRVPTALTREEANPAELPDLRWATRAGLYQFDRELTRRPRK